MALKDHMTRKLVTIHSNESSAEALRLMKNFWIRHLPVLDEEENYIIGMLSERDILSPSAKDTPVKAIMSTPIRTFDIETPLKNVVESMIEEKISAYLITKNDEVVGIITSEDMLLFLDQILTEKDENPSWVLGDLLSSPTLQKAAYLVGQAGV